MSPRARLARGEGAMLREEILEAADELLIETASEEAVSIRAIAAKVGVTPPSIYRHFADKDDLMFAVCERSFGKLDDAMAKAAVGIDDPVDALAARGMEYIRFGLSHPEHYRFLTMTPHDDVSRKGDVVDGRLTGSAIEGTRTFNNLIGACEEVVRSSGRPDPDGDDAIGLAVHVWTIVHGITALRITFPTMPWPPLDEQMARVTDGLRVRYGPAEASAGRASGRRRRSGT